MPDLAFIETLASLPNMGKPALSELWRHLFQKKPPAEIRRELMIRIVASRLQAQAFGGLSTACSRRLRQLATTFDAHPDTVLSIKPPIKPGTRLVRQWKEQVHVVEVQAEGYAYRGSQYENLSEIARLITGTRWSGPLFFGLRTKPSTEVQEAL